MNISAQTFSTSYWVAHYLKVNTITAISSYPFLTLVNYLYNNWLKLFFFFQIIIIIDLQYVSFSKLPFNDNDTNFQIEQIVLLISLSIVLTLYIIFDWIIIITSAVAVALYEERIYIGLSCYPILFSTFLNKIHLNYNEIFLLHDL